MADGEGVKEKGVEEVVSPNIKPSPFGCNYVDNSTKEAYLELTVSELFVGCLGACGVPIANPRLGILFILKGLH